MMMLKMIWSAVVGAGLKASIKSMIKHPRTGESTIKSDRTKIRNPKSLTMKL
jgi:hypothetical protein